MDGGEVRWRGECWLLFAFDIGHQVDLERAGRLISESGRSQRLKHRRHAPEYFQFDPPPLRAREEGVALPLEHSDRRAALDLWLYDFGGLSVSYRVEFEGTLEQWIAFSCELSDSAQLSEGAFRRAREFLETVGEAISGAGIAELVEDYVVFHVEPPADFGDAETFVGRHAGEIARLLRAERARLAAQETADALTARVAFGERDVAVIDWNAALLVDDEPDDVIAVLEFANLHLLEMRYVDERLDRALDQAYDQVQRQLWRGFRLPGSIDRDVARISRWQVDSAILFERVSNALKLYNDQYLARIYRQASTRLRLSEWNSSILRKLDALDGIYQKLLDRVATRRMEFLEWIIIALIALSMLLPFVPGYA